MLKSIFVFLFFVYLSKCQITFQQPLAISQSGIVVLYNSTTPLTSGVETKFIITYTKSHSIAPTPFYFLNRYKMNDKFVYQNMYSYIFEAQTTYWVISVQPISTTNILILSISYISLENTYENFFVKYYTYGTQTGLSSGSGSRSYTATYNFSTQFGSNYTLNSTQSKNNIVVSLTGFYHSTVRDVDIYIHSYMMNSSFFAVSMSTTLNDYWYRLNVLVCIMNVGKFPSMVKTLTGTTVLSISNTVFSWSDFSSFSNVSYCLGYSGFTASVPDKQDFFWSQFNSTTIQANLSLMTFARYSYIFIWNITTVVNNTTNNTIPDPVVPVDPVTPVDPVDPVVPVDPVTPTVPENTQPVQSSSSPIGIIIGVIIGLIAAGLIVAFLVYRFKFSKGTRVPIPQHQRDSHLFMPSFN